MNDPQCPAASRKPGKNNRLPIHNVCVNKTPEAPQLLAEFLETDPGAARIQDEDGSLSLHIACQGDVLDPEDVVEKLLKAYPEATAVAQNGGCLPAHTAAQCSTVNVLKQLLDAYPEALTVVVGRYGTLLYHAADSDIKKVYYLTSLAPNLISIRDAFGEAPLHHATYHSNNIMIRTVFVLDPMAVRVADTTFGCLPLHGFINDRDSPSYNDPLSDDAVSLRFLLSKYPQAAGIADLDGDTPYSLCRPEHSYARRLLLIAAPTLDPAELARVTYAARRMALFLAFTAVPSGQPGRKTKAPLLRRLVVATGGVDVLRYLVAFL